MEAKVIRVLAILTLLLFTSSARAAALIATPSSITASSMIYGSRITRTINFTSDSGTPVTITSITHDRTAAWDAPTFTPGQTPTSMTLALIPEELPMGTYNDTLVVASTASNNPLRIPVTFTITYETPGGRPSLVVSPTSINNTSVPIGTQTTLSPSISVSSSNSTPISFSLSTQTNNQIGPKWLSATVDKSATGTTPATVTVTANLAGFAPTPQGKTYTGAVTVTPTSPSLNGPQVIQVTITATGVDSLKIDWTPVSQAAQTMGLSTPSKTTGKVTVSSQSGSPLYYTAAATVITPPGGSWLQVSPMGQQQTSSNINVSLNTAGLSGSYQGKIDFIDTSNTVEVTLFVTVEATGATLIATPSSVTISSPVNSTIPDRSISLTSSNPATPITLLSLSDDGAPWVMVSGSGTSAGGNTVTPGTLNLSFNTANLAAGQYNNTIRVDSNATNNPLTVPVTLNISGPTVQTISHITYGGPWQTTIILVNMDRQAANYTVNFWGENGTPLTVPLALGSATGPIPVAGRVTLQTGGTAADITNGWAEVVSGQQIGGTAIFRVTDQNQEAAVPLLTSGGSTAQVPFDTGGGLAIGIALVNPSQSTAAPLNMTMRDLQGNILPMTITDTQGTFSPTAVSSLTLPPHTHRAFNAKPLNATGQVSGVIQFDAPTTPIYALGVRSVNNQAFTSINAAFPQPPATKTVSHVTYGGPWQTTIILVNMDSQPAQYTVNFWSETGAALGVPLAAGATSGTIPVGGRATIQTGGASPNITNGWAEVVSPQQIGGTAIFRVTDQNQEAAVPLLASGGSKVLVPFDTGAGFAIGIALVNPSQTTTAQITVTMRDQQGVPLAMTITDSQGAFSPTAINSLTLPPHSHLAFNAKPLASSGQVSGVIEFNSPGAPVYALGIRSVGSHAFTSIQALAQ
jgi:hypothetical protein